MLFKWSSICTKEPVCRKYHQTITLPEAALNVYIRQYGSKLSCCFCQTMTLPAQWSSWYLRLTRPSNVFPICYCLILLSRCELYLRIPVLSRQEWHSLGLCAEKAHLLYSSTCLYADGVPHTCNEWSFETLLNFCHLKPSLPILLLPLT